MKVLPFDTYQVSGVACRYAGKNTDLSTKECGTPFGQGHRAIVSEIRHRISETLARAGIVIAFPQRDVHIDAQSPIAVKIIPPGH